MDCIFCKIAGKKIPAEFIHETERFIAVKDKFPQSPTHILIIPKTHYSSLMECNDETLLRDMMLTAKEVAKKIGVGERGFRLVINTNKEGGQTVFHLHMHLMAGRTLSGDMG
ncbi:MAG: histidine triad nucleotide-binding protein [Thermodesulfobacteriota bacterium]